ncbi:LysR family transcriptional regulator [Spongiibacter sp. KMU-166]|uniref:LysR family transcriptional regulator n=1 Tax=Spongiibacter thalassae TaxID=2721624 RepID=A0ABX1GBI2_9GAMM|nr:LysR family transcriptional regulator [Spongiibacter thalassae]NKI16520.1 LysR family transcriptional regulator [Spongiibacter thalassae]
MPIDLRKLQHVCILASERNFTKAADKLCITQPALSRSITKLEEELGLQLFNRNPGDIALTPAGKSLVERAKLLLENAQHLHSDMALIRDGLSGNLAIGMAPYPAVVFLSSLTNNVLHEQPGVKIQVEVASRDRLLAQLNAENIEFFVAGSSLLSVNEQYLVEPLIKMRLSLFVRKGHPILKSKVSSARELLHYPFIGALINRTNANNFKVAMGLPESADFKLTVACDDFSVLKPLALSSDAILIAPHRALGKDLENGNLKEVGVCGDLSILANAAIEICLVRFANRVLSPAAQAAIAFLKNFATQSSTQPNRI